jgi:nitrogen regulatory protein PII-like uncharacterized protein
MSETSIVYDSDSDISYLETIVDEEQVEEMNDTVSEDSDDEETTGCSYVSKSGIV